MNFYKILNENETHYKLQYQTGLNIDPVPFDPSGDCMPGGIYFSREDILSFLDYGPWIRKVTIPEDAQLYENPGEPKKWKADRVILGERERITIEVIKRLIEEGASLLKSPLLQYTPWFTKDELEEIERLIDCVSSRTFLNTFNIVNIYNVYKSNIYKYSISFPYNICKDSLTTKYDRKVYSYNGKF
jgi:hypothetical protein